MLTTKFRLKKLSSCFLFIIGFAVTSVSGQNFSQGRANSGLSTLPASLQHLARKAGNRIVSRGKERSALRGTIQYGGSPSLAIQVVAEVPKRIRIEQASRAPIGVSDTGPWKANGALSADEEDLIETLLSDSIEGFLSGQSEQLPTRFLGARFRADDGRTPAYKGPYYDLYQTLGGSKTLPRSSQAPKIYSINSETSLLEEVRYAVTRVGRTTAIVVRLSQWRKFGDEMMPTLIQRFENGTAAVTITITDATFSPSANDKLFERP